ncbi:hypothetical protein E2C01_026284 [Portunus trituberculatus]|uniref:Uncharacterized protein n=1 Tax=Portunus trituberculatus TaxID=210409 RepID=A0A5B7EHP5_PORTR|nr:hypothetical protein [Portunus trituberculatus]
MTTTATSTTTTTTTTTTTNTSPSHCQMIKKKSARASSPQVEIRSELRSRGCRAEEAYKPSLFQGLVRGWHHRFNNHSTQ